MKIYIYPLILFVCSYLVTVLLYGQIKVFFIKEITTTILKITLGIFFFIYTLKFIENKKSLFQFSGIEKKEIQLTLFLALIFGINNYFHSRYSINIGYMKTSIIGLTILNYIINSFFEEFAYRGFLQGYVNQNTENIKMPISQGNLFASILMVITHLGFFLVMDTVFAITGVILVFVYSLTAGYLRDNGTSLWALIAIHTFINFIHLFINIEHYI